MGPSLMRIHGCFRGGTEDYSGDACISEEHSVELAAYRLKDLSYDWVVA